ncbi:MAG: MurR/RpiR family transcriptional regulator [Bacteroidetes bacterium]|nr:MurR/RpiR family transcriptional regulator [Bacteroidota bacterium]
MNREATRFRQQIADSYNRLSANQKKVADYLLHNMREAAFLSVTEIGEKCGASKATVVRFAQELGFEGFIDFRDKLTEAVNTEFAYLTHLQLKNESGFDSLFQVARQDVDNINETFSQINPEVFRDVVQSFLNSKMIFAAGLGISHLLSEILAYTLLQVGVRSVAFRQGYQTFEEQLHLLSEDDLLVVFSFPPYSTETLELAEKAKKANIKVVAFTNKLTAPIAEFADFLLPVKSENLIYCNSIASSLVVVNALATEIAIRSAKEGR